MGNFSKEDLYLLSPAFLIKVRLTFFLVCADLILLFMYFLWWNLNSILFLMIYCKREKVSALSFEDLSMASIKIMPSCDLKIIFTVSESVSYG